MKLLKQADEMRLKVNRFREGVSGTLRIAVSPDFSLSVVLKAIQKMSIEWPHIEIFPMLYGHKKSGLTAISDRAIGGYSDYIPGRGGGCPGNQL